MYVVLSSSVFFVKELEDQERIAPPLCYFPQLRAQEAGELVQSWYNTSGNQ